MTNSYLIVITMAMLIINISVKQKKYKNMKKLIKRILHLLFNSKKSQLIKLLYFLSLLTFIDPNLIS